MAIILVVCAGILALTRWLGPEDPIEINSMKLSRLAMRSGPLGRLLFPIAWAGMILFAAGIRYLSIVIMDEANKNFKDLVIISSLAYLPLILLSGLLGGILNNLFPVSIHGIGIEALFELRNIGHMVLLLIAIIWELYIWINGGRMVFAQNRGRALITFGAPYIVGLVFCCAPMVLLLNLAY